MKNVIKGLATIALIVLAVVAGAKDLDPSLRVYSTGDMTFGLLVDNISGKVEVKIQNEAGELIYSENLLRGKFAKRFDMSQLPDGSYTLEIVEKTRIKTMPLIVKGAELLIQQDEMVTSFYPTIYQKGDMVSVNLFAMNGEALEIEVFNENSEMLHAVTVEGNSVVGKRINFSQAGNGQYKVVATSGSNRVVRYVDVKK